MIAIRLLRFEIFTPLKIRKIQDGGGRHLEKYTTRPRFKRFFFIKFGPMTHYTYIICTNHNCQISFVFVYILYGFLYKEGANSWEQVLVCCMQLS